MAMDRWNPFRDMLTLREAMDRMFDESMLRTSLSPGRAAGFPIDLAETDQGFTLRATLPGVKPEDVQITIHGDTLTIRGESQAQEERKEQNWIIREHRSGSFHRMVTLPAAVNAEQSEARFQDGILELTLPKAEQARPRQIRVSGGASPGSAQSVQPVQSPPTQQPQQPAGTPATPTDKDRVTESSEESMGTSDAPAWTQERT
jgi:HSP20 family protein